MVFPLPEISKKYFLAQLQEQSKKSGIDVTLHIMQNTFVARCADLNVSKSTPVSTPLRTEIGTSGVGNISIIDDFDSKTDQNDEIST